MIRSSRTLGIALILAGVGTFAASGQERVFRTFGPEHGLEVPPVWALAQDSVGFIWIGAESGLFRFDGAEIVRWASQRLPRLVMDIAVSTEGRVVVMAGDGRIHELRGPEAIELEVPWVPRDTPRRSGRVMAFDGSGALWVGVGDSIWTIGAARASVHRPSELGGETTRGLVRAATGVLVLTDAGLWRLSSDARPERLYRVDDGRGEVLAWAIEPEPGRVLALVNVRATSVPYVLEIRDGVAREIGTAEPLPETRAITLVERRGTIWVALDRFLVAVTPGERPELLGPDEGFESGGPLLVDREGSLWVGSFVGLHQYVEPDTRIWAERQGIPSRHTRFVERSGSSYWVMTWSGPAVIERTARGWRATRTAWDSRSPICTSTDGTAWTASEETLLEIHGSGATPREGLTPPIHGCASTIDGGVWLGNADGLAWVHPERAGITVVEAPFPDEVLDPRSALLHDREGRIWVAAGGAACHAPASRLLRGETGLWACDDVAPPSGLAAMAQLDDGRLWAAAGPGGLLENRDGTWAQRRIEGVPTQTVNTLVPSPRGGTWIVGGGMLIRVRVTASDELEVLERLTPWHGIPGEVAGDLLEEPSGDVWLATNQGVAHVPAGVRFTEPLLPPVALVEARVDDRRIPIDGSLTLPHDENRLELRFAALSFRHRAGLLHEVRLTPDDPWRAAHGEPLFRWVDLPAGTYHAEYRASRDGVTWSSTAADFTFRIEPPWYRAWWFLLLTAATALGAVALLYRARVGYLLGLERQRTRIAMDLHDQVGSGLASVGILSGVLASDGLESHERLATAREIAEVAEELGHSLSDIVWALDPETASLEELSARLREHGERLFPDEDVRFEARLPDRWPPVTSSVAVRRSVLLIGLEALHNAARHAGGRRVTLWIQPRARGWWELAVHDDGSGIAVRDGLRRNGGSGRGLASMEKRAEAIGATLAIDSGPARGTTVTLRFHPHEGRLTGAGRRVARALRTLGRMIMRRRPHV